MEDETNACMARVEDEKRVLHMSYKAHECLYMHLRPERPGHDWKTLADLMGFTNQEISYYACDSNPVETIVEKWERRSGSTLSQLLDFLKKMERDDVIEDFQPFIDNAPTPMEYQTSLQEREEKEKEEKDNLTIRPMDEQYDAFICYGKGDYDFAEEVCRKLEAEPYNRKICIDLRDIIPVSNTTMEAVMATVISKRCKKILVILSENFNKSEEADFQGKVGLNRSPGAWQRIVIPILYKECEIPIIYRYIYHLDYTNERARVYFWDKLAKSLGYEGPLVYARSSSRIDSEMAPESSVEGQSDGKLNEEKMNGEQPQSKTDVIDDKESSDNSLENGRVVEPVEDKKRKNIGANKESKPKKNILKLRILKKNKEGKPDSPS